MCHTLQCIARVRGVVAIQPRRPSPDRLKSAGMNPDFPLPPMKFNLWGTVDEAKPLGSSTKG
ncbi:MAG: hypothetical protein ACTH1D_14660, partial [Mycobacteriaceae bacterium]